MNLLDFRFSEPKTRSEINYLRTPSNIFKFNDEGMNTLNNVIEYLENNFERNEIVWTRSGGISIKRKNLRLPAWDIRENKTRIEVILISIGYCARWQLSVNAAQVEHIGKNFGGRQAYLAFRQICKKFNIDLNKYAIENGEEVKKTIEKPMVGYRINCKLDKTYYNVHHLDLNSSYMSGIAIKNPGLARVIQYIYDKRKSGNEIYKAILNNTYGFFQSPYCAVNKHKYAFAHLSKDAIAFNNEYIRLLIEHLQETGRNVLMVNTDGIWYQGEIFEDRECGFGSNLGQWKTDYRDCKFKMRSSGSYQIDGTEVKTGRIGYKAFQKGYTKLDRVKPRAEWEWDDIYECGDEISYHFNRKTNRVVRCN